MTIGDMIRSFSDEEMAEFIDQVRYGQFDDEWCDGEGECYEQEESAFDDVEITGAMCHRCRLRFLKKDADDAIRRRMLGEKVSHGEL